MADWIEMLAKPYQRSVTLSDFEKLVQCLSQEGAPSQTEKIYKQNIEKLFWSSARSDVFLTQLPQPAYDQAYKFAKANPPDPSWTFKEIMYDIHEKAIICKSVMLNVGFWFNPDLEEPANRANVKPPMIQHFKPCFSKFNPTQPEYEGDDSWREQALALQKIV